MGLIRVTRGIPKYNIQIGPMRDAQNHNASAILSVTDHFDWTLMQLPNFRWMPINEISKSWGYLPFFAVKSILDFWCLEMALPLVYLGCSAGKHRSVMSAFCWLLSQNGATPQSVAAEFYGSFEQNVVEMYLSDVKHGYIPEDLPEFYALMRVFAGTSYRNVLQNMRRYEKICYSDSKVVLG